MWQRFTERARRVVFFAQEEAGRLGENCVSTEHLLLGITREKDSAAARVLDAMGVSLDQIRSEIECNLTPGEGRTGQDFQLTPRAKRVIDLAYDEARNLGHEYIGSEHLLLGFVREGEGMAGRILQKLDVELESLRRAVMQLPHKEPGGPGPEAPVELEGTPSQGLQVKTTHAWRPTEQETRAEGFKKVGLMKGKNLLTIDELSRIELEMIFQTTRMLKEHKPLPEQKSILAGKTLAMIFEKPSLRTRVSFETGIFQLGGHGIYLAPSDISLGKRESIADVARTLGRMSDIIMARVFAHSTVTELAEYAGVPVINGLSDLEHPCQALADFYTILERKDSLDGLKLAFIGDGNNVAHSLMMLAAKVGTNFTIGCPEGYEPKSGVVKSARTAARETGAAISVVHDPVKAAEEADVIYTDVWASMGQEDEAKERAKKFEKFQVNRALMKHAKPDAIFMHCLPAHRGSEVTDEVVDSAQSVVFDEAENRLHAQKAVMALLAG